MQTLPMDFQQIASKTGADVNANLANQPLNSKSSPVGEFSATLRQQLATHASSQSADSPAQRSPQVLPANALPGMKLPLHAFLREPPSEDAMLDSYQPVGNDLTELEAANLMAPIPTMPSMLPQTTTFSLTDVAPASLGQNTTAVSSSDSVNTESVQVQALTEPNAIFDVPLTNQPVTSSITQSTTQPSLIGKDLEINRVVANTTLINSAQITVDPESTNTRTDAEATNIPITMPSTSKEAALSKQTVTVQSAVVPATPAIAAKLTTSTDTPALITKADTYVPLVDDVRLPLPTARSPLAGTPIIPLQNTLDTPPPQSAITDSTAQTAPAIARALERMWSEAYRGTAPVAVDSKSPSLTSEQLNSDSPDVADLFSAESATVKPMLTRAPASTFGQVLAQYQMNSPPGSQAWGSELGQRVVWMAQQADSQQALLQLNPRHLGPMEIHISVNHEQQVNLSFTSHSATVREALDSAMPRLREMLDQQGLTLSDANVSDQQPGRQQTTGQGLNRSGTSPAVDSTESLTLQATTSTLLEPGQVNDRRVDLYA